MFKNAFYFAAGSVTTLVAFYNVGAWFARNRPEFMQKTIRDYN